MSRPDPLAEADLSLIEIGDYGHAFSVELPWP
jgi:hypothetical protein